MFSNYKFFLALTGETSWREAFPFFKNDFEAEQLDFKWEDKLFCR